jgi:hypothetical protein
MGHRPLLRGKPGPYARAIFLPVFILLGSVDLAMPEPAPSDPAQAPSQPAAASPEGKGEPPAPRASRDEGDKKPEAAVKKDAAPDAKPSEVAKDSAAPEPNPAQPVAPSNPASKDATAQSGGQPETKPSAKPAEENAASVQPQKDAPAPRPAKPAETKDAAAAAKPRDITPKAGSPEALVVQASSVNAVYTINWLGTSIGDFKIRSSVTDRQYSLSATADVSVFFGAVSWQGITTSRGLMTANGPVPQSYNFHYSTNDRRESIDLRFQQRMVSDIIINPPQHPGSRNVPITAADLQNVLDPLSAVLMLSQGRLNRQSTEACNKRIPIFDGKIRYDLVLSLKGTHPIGAMGRLHGVAQVCRVNYVPIAGHKPGKQGADYATGNTGIEVWLVPVPEAGLLVPYYVHVPTPAGTASLVAAKFDIETPGGRHALAD